MREWKPHSEEKISIFKDYIQAFANAAKDAYSRVYIDAFAGDTINMLATTGELFPGSAEIALNVSPQFTYVALFELQHERAEWRVDASPVVIVTSTGVVTGTRVSLGPPETRTRNR